MKKTAFVPFLLILAINNAYCQQSLSANFLEDLKISEFKTKNNVERDSSPNKLSRQEVNNILKDYRKSQKLDLPKFGIDGSGNLNRESLEAYNASGKITLFARPVQFKNNALAIYASFNKNASNNDSILYQKLIFPEIGNNSFLGTAQLEKYWKKDSETGHVLSPFFEFSYKNIISDSSNENQKLHFTTLNYTLGVKYIFAYSKSFPPDTSKKAYKKLYYSFFAIPYLSFSNIPNEDTADYRALLTRNVKLDPPNGQLTDNITTAGFKIGFQVNGLQVFADFRSVINKPEKVPIRELKGFHANIGLVFNADGF
jgi:hypothetical protein